jgi:nucleotide-binding universal stress UspA family protein
MPRRGGADGVDVTESVVAGVSALGARQPMVRWAAREAAYRGAELRLVTAHPEPELQETALLRLAAVVAAERPDLVVRTESVVGPPAAVLRDAAEDADLLVVGADDASPFAEAIAGSVPGDLLTTAPCPLAVAPRREWTTPESAPVVVAVDDQGTSKAALAYAFAAASRSGRSLMLLQCLPGGGDSGVDRALIGFDELYPGVDVTTEIRRGDVADTLVTVSRVAAQLVLGSRGRGRLASGLFGSVSRSLIRRAGCPVVVARARTGAGFLGVSRAEHELRGEVS